MTKPVNVFDLAARLAPFGGHNALRIVRRLGLVRKPVTLTTMLLGTDIPDGTACDILEDLKSLGIVTEQVDRGRHYSLNREAFARLVADLSSLGQGSVP